MTARFRYLAPLFGVAILCSAAVSAEEAGSEAPVGEEVRQDFSDNVVVTGGRIQDQTRRRNDGPVWRGPIILPDGDCTNRIIEAYGEEGDAQLQRQPASPDRPLHVLAVDHRVQGCSVLVLEDGLKQLPPAPSAEATMVPAQ